MAISRTFAVGLLMVLQVGNAKDLSRGSSALFTQQPPQSEVFKTELQYLGVTQKLSQAEKAHIETQLTKAEKSLGVPKALLWCVLFQESRFDRFKNAFSKVPAKGLGQFTRSALSEVNH